MKTKWTSAIIGKDHYKTELITDSHMMIADEPLEVGGKDLGPEPGDFLRMSLASCTAITLRMYSDRKGLAVEQIEVKVHSEKKEDKTIFYRDVILTGNLDEHQRARLLQIANACPVHKVLTHPIEIQTKIS
ncbi:MAG: OsmC family protein [Bacteroidota bacterium]